MTQTIQEKLKQAQQASQTQQKIADNISGLTTEGNAVAEAVMSVKTARVFYGEFPTFQNYLTNSGKTVAFYRGFCKTSDPEIIEYCDKIPSVVDVTDTYEGPVPVPPTRERNRNWASAQRGPDPTVFNPLELLQRAVASSAQVTQAADSNSTN